MVVLAPSAEIGRAVDTSHVKSIDSLSALVVCQSEKRRLSQLLGQAAS